MLNAREILIVEDNPGDVRLMREALKLLDPPVNVNVVHDGEEALLFLTRKGRFSEASKPVLVFLDFNLPGTDSREILSFIKTDAELQSTAVLILTSSSSEEDICAAYRLHANCFLSKPQDLDRFLNTIRGAAEYWLNLPEQTSGICYDSSA